LPQSLEQKINNTANSFPAQNAGAVAKCPFEKKESDTPSAPISAKTSYHLTQKTSEPSGAAGQPAEQKVEKKDWIEIVLVDMEGKPVPNVRYRITPPGGAPVEGRLNEHGQAGLYQIESGSCKITFPDLDSEAWD
jgi:hypothetical protein